MYNENDLRVNSGILIIYGMGGMERSGVDVGTSSSGPPAMPAPGPVIFKIYPNTPGESPADSRRTPGGPQKTLVGSSLRSVN